MFSKVIAFTAILAVALASLEPVNHAPQPYKFGYDIKDKHGNQYREEQGDGAGGVKGSYGFTDERGVRRQVDYVADKGGFRAQVKTNEPGTANQDPAAVKMISDAPYAGGVAIEKSYGGLGYSNERNGLAAGSLRGLNGRSDLGISNLGGLGYGVNNLDVSNLGGLEYGGDNLDISNLGGLGYGVNGLGLGNLGGLGYGVNGLGLGNLGGLRYGGYGLGGNLRGLGYGSDDLGIGRGLRYGGYGLGGNLRGLGYGSYGIGRGLRYGGYGLGVGSLGGLGLGLGGDLGGLGYTRYGN